MAFSEFLKLAEYRGYCLGAESTLSARRALSEFETRKAIALKMHKKGKSSDEIFEITGVSL